MTRIAGSIVVTDAPDQTRYAPYTGPTTVPFLAVSWMGYRPALTDALQRMSGGACYWEDGQWLIEAKLADKLYAILAPTWWHVLWLSKHTANPNHLVRDLALNAEQRRREQPVA